MIFALLIFFYPTGFKFLYCYVFYIDLTSCLIVFTRRVSHVKQTWLTIPEQRSSSPVFREIRSLIFCVMFCRSFILLSFFLLVMYCVSFFDIRILQIFLRYFWLNKIITSYNTVNDITYMYILFNVITTNTLRIQMYFICGFIF